MQVRYLTLLLLSAACTTDARAQRTNDAAARRIILSWTDNGTVPPSEVAEYRSLARRDCDRGQGISGAEYGRCSAVMLVLAEEDLAAVEREYEVHIDEASAYVNEVDQRAVWRYAQRRWRELRDADCAELGIGAGGGSGTGASVSRCMAGRTLERAQRLRVR